MPSAGMTGYVGGSDKKPIDVTKPAKIPAGKQSACPKGHSKGSRK